MLCRFEFTAFLLCRLSPEFVAVLSFSGGGTNVGCMEVPQSQFKEAPISSPNIGSKPGGLFACTDLLMGEEIPLCLCFAYNWLYFISLHTAVISNHRCFILPATNIKVFKSKSHALRKSIKVVCTKITIVTVTFCVQSFFWYLSNKLSSVMNGALIVFSLGSKTKVSADIFLVFFEGSPRRMSFCVKSYKTYQKKKVTCQSNSGVLCF